MKIYLKKNGQVFDVQDTEFTSNAVGNFVRYYFVDDNGAVVDNPEISFVNISFKREDGFVIANRMAAKNQAEKYWEYVITETDGVLYRRGALLVSAQFTAATYDTENPYHEPIEADETTAGVYYTRSGTAPNYVFTAVTLPEGFEEATTYYARYYNITARTIVATATQPAHVVYNIGIADVDELDAAFRAERLARENLAGLITGNGVKIERNTNDILDLQGLTATHTVAIEQNAGNIDALQNLTSDQTAEINQNTIDIGHNTGDIEELQQAVSEADEKFRRKDDSYSAEQTDIIFRRKDDSVSLSTYAAEQGAQDNRLNQSEAAIGTADISAIAADVKLAILSLNDDVESLQEGVVPRINRGLIEYASPTTTPDSTLIALMDAFIYDAFTRTPDNTDKITVADSGGEHAGTYYTYCYWKGYDILTDGWYWSSISVSDPVTQVTTYTQNILIADWGTPDGEGYYTISITNGTHGQGSIKTLDFVVYAANEDGTYLPVNLAKINDGGTVTIETDETFTGFVTIAPADKLALIETVFEPTQIIGGTANRYLKDNGSVGEWVVPDGTPTAGSQKLITSGGAKTALDLKATLAASNIFTGIDNAITAPNATFKYSRLKYSSPTLAYTLGMGHTDATIEALRNKLYGYDLTNATILWTADKDGMNVSVPLTVQSKAIAGIYDKVIATQAEFEALIASATWLDAVSVALVGQFTLSTANNSGIEIPATVKQIHGFNNAKITITNGGIVNGLKYSTLPTTEDYEIKNVFVDVSASSYGAAFLNCRNLINCGQKFIATGTFTNASGFSGCKNIINCSTENESTNTAHGFFNCDNVIDCYGQADASYGYGFFSCTNVQNCVGKGLNSIGGGTGYGFANITRASNCSDGGSTTGMWAGTNSGIDPSAYKTAGTVVNATLNA